MKKVKAWLLDHSITVKRKQMFYINGYNLPREMTGTQVIKASIERVGSEDKLIEAMDRLYKTSPYRGRALINELLTHLSTWKVHVGIYDPSMNEDLNDPKYIALYSEKYNVSEQQMRCDHDDYNQYADDGVRRPHTGKCQKCLLDKEGWFWNNNDTYESLLKWKTAQEIRSKLREV